MFEKFNSEGIIILEDDMLISPDFFEYFNRVSKFVLNDSSLYCASAWNDNGKKVFSWDAETIVRTNFFPGLGWFLANRVWDEISLKWPDAFWDDWMRDLMKEKKKFCLYPEISRTFTFGEFGSSGGQFYHEFLKKIKLNEKMVDWKNVDLSYLEPNNWDHSILKNLSKAGVVNKIELGMFEDDSIVENKKIYYKDENDFISIVRNTGIISEFKAGNPRCSYKGILQLGMKNAKFYLVPTTLFQD